MIHFHTIGLKHTLKHKKKVQATIHWICSERDFTPGDINIILCTDEYLLGINHQYLSHDDFTDIITFDYVEGKVLSGDLFISLERVKENAHTFHVKPEEELLRVIFHGVWHLAGYKDKSEKDSAVMRQKENEAISYFKTL